MAAAKKQAIVVIHGMGEQSPMTTIRSFVESLWSEDEEVLDRGLNGKSAGDIWSKPDASTGSLELRRLTTRASRPSGHYPEGVRSDFYECYWADLTEGTTWDSFSDWFGNLLLRWPRRVPDRVLDIWSILWLLTGAVAIIAIAIVLKLAHQFGFLATDLWVDGPLSWIKGWHSASLAIVVGVIAVLAVKFSVQYLGDVARYTRPAPANIAIRRDIRARGLELLRSLHDDHDYDRILIAAHSLGSIIAYDLITFLWAERLDKTELQEDDAAMQALREVERLGAAMLKPGVKVSEAMRETYRQAQRVFQRALAQVDRPAIGLLPARPVWLISDLVTFASPLTHADFLLAYDEAELAARKAQREFPVCPPVAEPGDDRARDLLADAGSDTAKNAPDAEALLTYVSGDAALGNWKIHHAAPFAATRWTNLYDAPYAILFGDVIGGPLAPVFGAGIKDVPVRIIGSKWSVFARVFTHAKYWSDPAKGAARPSPHIEALRHVMDIAARE